MHKPVQAAVGRDDLLARAEHQVVGVTQHDLRAQPAQFVGRHRFHGAIGAHRHERRRLDLAAGELQAAGAGAAVGGV